MGAAKGHGRSMIGGAFSYESLEMMNSKLPLQQPIFSIHMQLTEVVFIDIIYCSVTIYTAVASTLIDTSTEIKPSSTEYTIQQLLLQCIVISIHR